MAHRLQSLAIERRHDMARQTKYFAAITGEDGRRYGLYLRPWKDEEYEIVARALGLGGGAEFRWGSVGSIDDAVYQIHDGYHDSDWNLRIFKWAGDFG